MLNVYLRWMKTMDVYWTVLNSKFVKKICIKPCIFTQFYRAPKVTFSTFFSRNIIRFYEIFIRYYEIFIRYYEIFIRNNEILISFYEILIPNYEN
jgi:hypothetical protein